MINRQPVVQPGRLITGTLVSCAALALGAAVLAIAGGCQSTPDTAERPGTHSTPRASGDGERVSTVLSAEGQRALTPRQVVEELKAGNQRFVDQRTRGYDFPAQVRQTAGGQFPKAVVLSCLDSRVPPEIIFDQGIGDIFVGRVAGNFENTDLLGSMEFATAAAGAKAIVVLGHTACGAVKGAVDNVQLGNLTPTLANITPAVETVHAKHPGWQRSSKNHEFVEAVALENVRMTVRNIKERSPVLAERVAKGELVIVGGMYDLSTGAVQWLN